MIPKHRIIQTSHAAHDLEVSKTSGKNSISTLFVAVESACTDKTGRVGKERKALVPRKLPCPAQNKLILVSVRTKDKGLRSLFPILGVVVRVAAKVLKQTILHLTF